MDKEDENNYPALAEMHVSVSNDGQHNSEVVLFTVFDSSCMVCAAVDSIHVCQQKVSFIIIFNN